MQTITKIFFWKRNKCTYGYQKRLEQVTVANIMHFYVPTSLGFVAQQQSGSFYSINSSTTLTHLSLDGWFWSSSYIMYRYKCATSTLYVIELHVKVKYGCRSALLTYLCLFFKQMLFITCLYSFQNPFSKLSACLAVSVRFLFHCLDQLASRSKEPRGTSSCWKEPISATTSMKTPTLLGSSPFSASTSQARKEG